MALLNLNLTNNLVSFLCIFLPRLPIVIFHKSLREKKISVVIFGVSLLESEIFVLIVLRPDFTVIQNIFRPNCCGDFPFIKTVKHMRDIEIPH